MGNIWIFNHYSIVPCPLCGGLLRSGEEWDTDPEWGGNLQDFIISCKSCGHFWNEDDMHDGKAPNISDRHHNILGWDLDGYWVNGCEGPVKPLPDGTYASDYVESDEV